MLESLKLRPCLRQLGGVDYHDRKRLSQTPYLRRRSVIVHPSFRAILCSSYGEN